MAKVELKKLSASPEGVFKPGDVIEVDKDVADSLIKSGQARLVEKEKKGTSNKGGKKQGDK